MIEQLNPAANEQELALRLTPNRSAGPRELVACFAALGTAAMGVAWIAAMQGNVFAPGFAVLDVAVIGWCFWRVRLRLAREETIAFSPDSVVVHGGSAEAEVRFQTAWVRLEVEPGTTRNEHERLMLRSHGRSTEIGAFLADAERAELKRKVFDALATVKGAARYR
ncbi:MAG TPA: DUF2244 domain-containing protein [Candidatus Saccharimonadia bacterium]|nr:DUF2244 domain-containing protein [Candidatus Saccharimonadia bacterium]